MTIAGKGECATTPDPTKKRVKNTSFLISHLRDAEKKFDFSLRLRASAVVASSRGSRYIHCRMLSLFSPFRVPWLPTLCGLLLTVVPAPWLHEHTGEYFHDHGSGLVHAHWRVDSSDQPLLKEPEDGVRYLDWLNVHYSSGGPDVAPGIYQSHAVITDGNGPLTAATDTPRVHGPPWLADLSPRSPPAYSPPAALPHS